MEQLELKFRKRWWYMEQITQGLNCSFHPRCLRCGRQPWSGIMTGPGTPYFDNDNAATWTKNVSEELNRKRCGHCDYNGDDDGYQDNLRQDRE